MPHVAWHRNRRHQAAAGRGRWFRPSAGGTRTARGYRLRRAQGILRQIRAAARPLIARHRITRVGIGFGGPIDAAGLRIVKSHQVPGWDNFPLVDWCQRELGLPAVLGNDADLGGLAEAHDGAGRDYNPVFYITVGTGIGGGLIIDRRVYRGSGHGAAELGHLRPGPDATDAHDTLESRRAAGPGIAGTVRGMLSEMAVEDHEARDMAARCGGEIDSLTAKIVGQAAAAGNQIARAGLAESLRVLGWAIAQMITLLAGGRGDRRRRVADGPGLVFRTS